MFFNRKRAENRFLIIGLGNPGSKYRKTRHNVGFMVLDYVADKFGIRVARQRFSSLVGEGIISGVPVLLLKPMTYMNLSGQAAAAASSYYKIPVCRVIVICDDVALLPGVIRIRDHGSCGGQKGLLSIEDMLDSTNYIRIRIGIGDRTAGELSDYVLAEPEPAQLKAITGRFPDVADALSMILNDNLNEAQSLFNGAGQ